MTATLIPEISDEEERHTLTIFRNRVMDILQTAEQRSDHFLARWIRVHCGHLEKAEKNIRKSFEWRKKNGIDKILHRRLDPFILENYQYCIQGYDLLGHPIVSVPIGKWDVNKIFATGKEAQFVNFVTYFWEDIMRSIRHVNETKSLRETRLSQCTLIVNCEGFSYNKLFQFKEMQLLLKFPSLLNDHYPELIFKGLYVNCTQFFFKFFAMVKMVLAPKTMEKLKLFGTNRSKWEKELKKIIHPDQLPVEYGGNLVLLAKDI